MQAYKLTIIFLFCAFTSVMAQDDPLQPTLIRSSDHNVGLILGIGQNQQVGSIDVICPDCTFEGGVGFGSTIAGYYEYKLLENLYVGAMLRYDTWGFESKFIDFQTRPVEIADLNQTRLFQIEFEQTLNTSINVIGITPHVNWKPFNFLFIRGGLSLFFPVSSNLLHNETLTQQTVKFDGQIYPLSIVGDDGPRQDTEVDGLESMIVGFDIMLGFPIEIAHYTYLVPGFWTTITSNDLSSTQAGFNLNRWRLSIELNYPLKAPPKTAN